MAAHRVAGAQRRLDVDRRTGRERAQCRPTQRFRDGVEPDPAFEERVGREADAVDGDRASDLDTGRGPGRVDLEPDAAVAALERGDAADFTDDAGEHPSRLPARVPEPSRSNVRLT